MALALGVAVITATANVLFSGQQANLSSLQSKQAQLQLQELTEISKGVAADDWTSVAANGAYHPTVSGGNWLLAPDQEKVDIYTRTIQIQDILRDVLGNIVTQGGVVDPGTKKITAEVSWQFPRSRKLGQTFLLTRWRNNQSWIEDTLADFSDGIEDATDFTTNPGYVQLAQTGGAGEWTEPTIIADADAQAKINGLVASSNGYLYAALGSAKKKIEVFDIHTDPKTPVSVNAFNTLDDINNLAVNGNWLYAALNSGGHGIQIFNIGANPINPPAQPDSIPIGGEPSGLWVQNNYLFASMVSVNKVKVYSLANPALPTYLGEFTTSKNTEDVSGSGNYLYVAQDDTAEAIQIFDISQSAIQPTLLGKIATFYSPTGIWLEGNTLYLSLKQKRAAMYTLTYNPSNPRLLGIFQTNQNTADITALSDYGYVAGMDSWQRAVEIVYVGDSKGLSGIYFVYGEYISSTLSFSEPVIFNRISWVGQEPGAVSNILFQISVNNDNQTWNFVGPDGTAASYFEDAGPIPLNSTLGRYFKYKIILADNSEITPRVDRVTINYSP